MLFIHVAELDRNVLLCIWKLSKRLIHIVNSCLFDYIFSIKNAFIMVVYSMKNSS